MVETELTRLNAWAIDTLPKGTFWTVRRVSDDLVRATVIRDGNHVDAVGETFVQALAIAAGKLRRGEKQDIPTDRIGED
jgi:hypothetical protein